MIKYSIHLDHYEHNYYWDAELPFRINNGDFLSVGFLNSINLVNRYRPKEDWLDFTAHYSFKVDLVRIDNKEIFIRIIAIE